MLKKKCIICGNPAEFCIKDSNDWYCKECAEENFADLSYLQSIEERAKLLKDMINEKISNPNPDNPDNNS